MEQMLIGKAQEDGHSSLHLRLDQLLPSTLDVLTSLEAHQILSLKLHLQPCFHFPEAMGRVGLNLLTS